MQRYLSFTSGISGRFKIERELAIIAIHRVASEISRVDLTENY